MRKPKKSVVRLSKFAGKQILRLPQNIQKALRTWVLSVEMEGIWRVRMIPGYHDEPLKGERAGQRSLRLNRSYRVIYEETELDQFIIIGIQEVNKHEY